MLRVIPFYLKKGGSHAQKQEHVKDMVSLTAAFLL